MKKISKILCFLCIFILTVSPIVTKYSYGTTNNSVTLDDDSLKKRTKDLEDSEKAFEERVKEEEEKRKQQERDANVSLELSSNFSELYADTNDKVSINIKNNGGSHVEKPVVKVTLPAELTLISGGSPSVNLSTVNVGSQVSASYDVHIAKDVKTGNLPITFEVTGKYGTSAENYKEYTTSKTFYIKVIKPEKKKDESQYKPFIISNISHPGVINKGDVANLSFKITNPNNVSIGSIKITVLPDEGIVNQTQNTFVENNFPANGSKDFSVKIFGKDGAEKKNYSIKLTVEPTNPSEPVTTTDSKKDDETTPKILPVATQYTGIFYNAPKKEDEENKNDGVKNPQIMITNYTYGGNPVHPTQEFPLTMTFINTSHEKTLRNIKISLTADEGTFIAIGSSNSFYVDILSPQASFSKTLNFSVKPDATTKTVGMNIDYAYEDTKGNALTAKDVISIPVLQKTVFKVDDVVQPQDVPEGDPNNISAYFYNLGKTQISNIKVTATGDFTPMGNPSYFLGNLDPGKSDSFSLSVIPNDPKKLSGVVTFNYETLDGKTNVIEKKFDFTLNPIPMEPIPEMPEMNQQNSNPNLIYFIIAGVVGLIALIVFLKIRSNKKKKLQELDLDE